MLSIVIASGQRGAELAALEAATRAQMATGGVYPNDCADRDRRRLWLRYMLTAHAGCIETIYRQALKIADGTCIFTQRWDPWVELLAACECISHPYILLHPEAPDLEEQLATWLKTHGVVTLQVIGDAEDDARYRQLGPRLHSLFRAVSGHQERLTLAPSKKLIHAGSVLASKAEYMVIPAAGDGTLPSELGNALKACLPSLFYGYIRTCDKTPLLPGYLHSYSGLVDEAVQTVIFLALKETRMAPFSIDALEDALAILRQYLLLSGARHVAMPALGVEKGGLPWARVEQLIGKYIGTIGGLKLDIHTGDGGGR